MMTITPRRRSQLHNVTTKMEERALCVLLVLTSFHVGFCFEKGAPFKMCVDAFPKHSGSKAQTSVCPFQIKLSKSTYSPQDNITVTIESSSGRMFRGFTLTAKPVLGDPEIIAGTFTQAPDFAKEFSWPFVVGKTNCLTHKDGEKGKAKLVAEWQAPDVSVGDVVFWGSIVEVYETFWINVSSEVVTANEPAKSYDYISKPSPVFNPRLVMDDCGRTKGCLLWPKYCTGYQCRYIVTYDARDTYVDFEMAGPAENYLSLGFSHDIIMGDDETITCVVSDSGISVQQGYNPKYYNDRLRADDLKNVQIQYEDGFLYCRFRRPKKMEVLHVTDPPKFDRLVFDLKDNFYAMIAWGPVAGPGSDVIYKHVELPLVSPGKVSFQSTDIVYMDALPMTIQAHAIMVFIAWIGLAGFAMIIGRHFREGFGGKMSCGVKAWFQIHRLSLSLVFVLTAASFVLIFIKVGGWKDAVTLHAAIGIVVMSLLCIQLLLALARPDPTSSKRPIFTWVHRIAGKLNHGFAAFCLMLGVNISLLPRLLIYRLTVLIGVWIGVQVLWEMLFEIMRCREYKQRDGFDTTISMDNMNNGSTDHKPSSEPALTKHPNGLLKRFLLVLYVVTTAVFVALAIAFILLV